MIVSDVVDKLSAADLRVIVLGLKVSCFNVTDETITNEIRKQISLLPSAETINAILQDSESFKGIRQRVGHIMEIVSTHGKRDVANKERYKARTGLDPRHKVLDYVYAEGVEQEKKANAKSTIKKHAADGKPWWDKLKGSPKQKDPVKETAENLFNARQALYTSYKQVLKTLLGAEESAKEANDQDASVISKMVAQLRESAEQIREPMIDINMSLNTITNFVETQKQEETQKAEEVSNAPVTEEEIIERAREIEDTKREVEEAEAQRQKQILQEKASKLDPSKVYYYKVQKGLLVPVQIESNEVNENLGLGGTQLNGNRSYMPNLNVDNFVDLENVERNIRDIFDRETDDEKRSYLNELLIDLQRGADSGVLPNIPKELTEELSTIDLTAGSLSSSRKVFNLKRNR